MRRDARARAARGDAAVLAHTRPLASLLEGSLAAPATPPRPPRPPAARRPPSSRRACIWSAPLSTRSLAARRRRRRRGRRAAGGGRGGDEAAAAAAEGRSGRASAPARPPMAPRRVGRLREAGERASDPRPRPRRPRPSAARAPPRRRRRRPRALLPPATLPSAAARSCCSRGSPRRRRRRRRRQRRRVKGEEAPSDEELRKVFSRPLLRAMSQEGDLAARLMAWAAALRCSRTRRRRWCRGSPPTGRSRCCRRSSTP